MSLGGAYSAHHGNKQGLEEPLELRMLGWKRPFKSFQGTHLSQGSRKLSALKVAIRYAGGDRIPV